MTWVVLLAAIVLGAGITWLLTVKRVTRRVGPAGYNGGAPDTLAPEPSAPEPSAPQPSAPQPSAPEPSAPDQPVGAALTGLASVDEPGAQPVAQRSVGEGLGETVEEPMGATSPDDAAAYAGTATTASSSRIGWDRTAQDEDALLPHDRPAPDGEPVVDAVPPIAGATPHGDLAGVTAPRNGSDGPEPAPPVGEGEGPQPSSPDSAVSASDEQDGPAQRRMP